MSSIRNSLHRRNHKERGQLGNRKRLGILEKHKDYALRAKDFNEKKEKIKRLKQKAADKNKDEFYFGMVGKKTQKGVHYQDRGNASLPIDLVKVLKTQDEGYLRNVRVTNLKRIDAIRSELLSSFGSVDAEGTLQSRLDSMDLDPEDEGTLRQVGLQSSHSTHKSSRHIIFVEDKETAKNYNAPTTSKAIQKPATQHEHIDMGWKTVDEDNRREADQEAPESGSMDNDNASVENHKRLLQELRTRLERDTHLRYALRELEMQRALMGKGASRKLRGPELIKPEGGSDEELDEDEQDALFGKKVKVKPKHAPDMVEYKPRVYKFRVERKR